LSKMKLPAGSTAVLADAFLNKETPLSITEANKVDFTVDANAASSGNRFRIVLSSNAITSVSTLEGNRGISIYPNPVQKGSLVQLQFINQPAGEYRLVLFDISGVQVQNRVLQHTGGTAVQPVTISDNLAGGNYIAELTDKGGKSAQFTITIQ
ncbi:MAG: T9SS type A sorting domain-containing protein, partial [Bacteroidetes bacterium]|nr:T9SS type A sorting domain-containing protein [Bacteroidota bacterium]